VSFLARLSALVWFLVASAWFLFSDLVASGTAAAVNAGDFQEPLDRILLLFLLIVGYWIMSRLGQRRMDAGKATALVPRPGWGREFALGAALGWTGVLACVLPVALIGGLVLTKFTNTHQYIILVLDLIALAAGTLAIEIAFRGYPFLRLVEAMGSGLAAFFMAVVFAIWRTHTGPTTTASVLVSFFLGLVLAVSVLRTRALWVSWGLNFGWKASRALIFGLAVSGISSHSPVVQGDPMGPFWLTGGGYGLDGTWIAFFAFLAALPVVYRLTRDLDFRYNAPVIVPGGIAVDLDAAARAQHEAAMGAAEPAAPALVQILPIQAPPPSQPEEPPSDRS